MKHCAAPLSLCLLLLACGESSEAQEEPPTATRPRVDYAIAIHGGAGVIPETMEEERKAEYFEALEKALRLGRDLLAEGGKSLDVVEQVIRHLEDVPLFNAGKGAVFTHQGRHELDAAIMDGSTLDCGSVAGVSTVKNPITLARHVMEDSRHVFFLGAGAEEFADQMGVERVEQDYFFVQRRYDQWQKKLEEAKAKEADKHGTVGAVVLDRHGNLAAATSTGGMTDKRYGRVGDVPIIGAGTYANNKTAAISCTGYGEQFIRNNVAHDISAMMEYKGLSVQEAAEAVIQGKLDPGDGGAIAVAHDGSIAMVFNSKGMFRGAADSSGRFEVAIWE